MLELHNLQKSSDLSAGPETHPEAVVETAAPAVAPTVYFDRAEAIRDFDRETEMEKPKASTEILDEKAALLVANARVLMKHREFALALNLLRSASNRQSKNTVILNLLAECLERTQRFDEALIVRSAAVKVACNFEQVHKLATLYYKLGKDEEAHGRYFEALSLLTEENEALFEIYKNIGNILVRQGDFEGAEEYYNKAYTLNPGCDTLLVNFGTLEVQRQDYDKSLYCFRQAVKANPKNDKAWVGLAMVHAQFGDHALAWANLETAVDINPSNRTAVLLLASWGVRDRREDQSIEVLQNYLGQVEFDEDMSLALINLYCSNSQISEAKLECERVLLWNPENQEVASLREKLKNIKRA
ncbi:MAG: tetratricopeptide repeat protein [Bdellovibrionales bacterium]|nr:tetratricopeptide repeat protein [Bdellovibrionales bacterium]